MKILYLVSLLLMSSCGNLSLDGQKDLKPGYVRVEELVNSGKYDEAMEIAKNENVQPYMGIKRIEAVKQCKPIMDECNVSNLTAQFSRNCLAKIEEGCAKKYLTIKYQDELTTLWNTLIDNKDKKTVDLSGMCADGMKWGYLRVDKKGSQHSLYTDRIDYKNLKGEYAVKDKCEEARLLEDSKYNTSKSCYWRYLGEQKKLSLQTASAMNGTVKEKFYFSTREKCEQVVKSGFDHVSKDGVKTSYGPLGSTKQARFIKTCEQEGVVVCKELCQGELFLEEII